MLFGRKEKNGIEKSSGFIHSAAMSVATFAKFVKLTGENTEDFIALAKEIRLILNETANRINVTVDQFKKTVYKNNYEHSILQDYMSEIATLFKKISNFDQLFSLSIQNNFIEPLETFHKESYAHNIHIYRKLERIVREVEDAENTLKNRKDLYYQYSSNAEKSHSRLEMILEKFEQGQFSKKDLEKEADKSTKLKILAEESRHDYEAGVVFLAPNTIEPFSFIPCYETFDLKEENRVELIRRKGEELQALMIAAYNKGLDIQIDKSFLLRNEETGLPKIISRIFPSSEDISKFKDYKPIEFMSYDKFKIEREQHSFDERFYLLEDVEEVNEREIDDLKKVITIVFSDIGFSATNSSPLKNPKEDGLLVNGKLNVASLDRLFSKGSIRDKFVQETLRIIPVKTHRKSVPYETLEKLRTVMKSIITNILISIERNPTKFLEILQILDGFISKDDEENKTLFQSFGDSALWNDLMMWKDCFQIINENKIKELENSRNDTGGLIPWRVINGLQNMIVRRNSELDEQKKMVFKMEALGMIRSYLSNLSLSLGYSTEILTIIVKEYEVEPNVLASEIATLEDKYYTRDIERIALIKTPLKDKLSRWGKDLVAFRMALDYLDCPTDLLEIICVNKRWYGKFKPFVVKKQIKSSEDLSIERRLLLWESNLEEPLCTHKYLGEDISKIRLSDDLEDVIKMDVVRSLPSQKGFNHEALKRILRSIAFTYSDSASYCQGMNYLAGLFLLYYKDEEKTYRLMCQLLETRMMEVFNTNFEHLQLFFYIIDRLMYLHINDLYEHFKEEKILPVFYSSGWFITLFSNTLQYTDISYLVFWIFDFYLAEGPKGLFKCIIVLMKYLAPRFLAQPFDQIMNFLSDITRKELFTNLEYHKYLIDKKSGISTDKLEKKYSSYAADFKFLDSFRGRVNRLQINSTLMKHLETKYKTINKKLKNKL